MKTDWVIGTTYKIKDNYGAIRGTLLYFDDVIILLKDCTYQGTGGETIHGMRIFIDVDDVVSAIDDG